MFRSSTLAILLASSAAPCLAGAGSKSPAAETPAPAASGPDFLTGQGVDIGGIIFPHFHFQAAYGRTSIEDGHDFAAGHHDPVTDGWTLQGFEAGLSVRAGEYFEGFGIVHVFEEAESGEWDHEFEEWFGKVKNLPGGLEVRGGKYLNRFGFQNALHQHGWDFADNQLVNGRFLGDHGLSSIGGELTWTFEPADQWTSVISLSAGEAQLEEHEDGHDHGDEEHGEALYDAERALFDSTVITANWTNVYHWNDFHQYRFGLSGAWGDNSWDRATQVYGLHAEYQWRENGLEPGGTYFRWRTEGMVREVDAFAEHGHEEHGHGDDHEEEHGHGESPRPGSFGEFGITSSVLYGIPTGFAGPVEFALRGEYVEGVADAGLAERFRISPGVRLYLNDARSAHVGLQYNHDDLSPGGTEDSVWLQIGINWGGPEVR